MINGVHVILYSKDAAADRVFLAEVIGLPGLDIGHGWVLFKAPPAELAVHPADDSERHELYLMCDDVEAEIARLTGRGVACDPISDQRWGRVTRLQLPGGGKLALYEPHHERP